MEATTACGRRVSISGMLKKLGVSRSGYRAFLHRKPSASQQRKEAIKESIKQIHDDSKQNYGAPKITQELRKSGETIAERTVGKYMNEMGFVLSGLSLGLLLQETLISAKNFTTYLMSNSILTDLMLSGVLT